MKTIKIDGMMCERCVAHVKKALESIGNNVEVSLEENKATLETEADDKFITQVIEDAGYEVEEII
ncbi:MAG: heavy metal-associated domain-containing protein [Erysipelotrichaceae bacterium]|nr:heavy metal-associated domain-containing protein [Erysipelotrichaceae bacterium]